MFQAPPLQPWERFRQTLANNAHGSQYAKRTRPLALLPREHGVNLAEWNLTLVLLRHHLKTTALGLAP